MHAYLLIGNSTENIKQKVEKLAKKLHAKIMEFPLVKIEDVRSLNNLIRLTFNEPTLIVSQNIHEAGEEALNAFLKNLEEPQENIYFALTSPSTRKVLPTIVSRCQILRTMNNPLRGNNSQFTINNDDAEKFIKLGTGERLAYIDKIKDRDRAIEFTGNLVNYLHSRLHDTSSSMSKKADFPKIAKNSETASTTLSSLKANGNVGLHLTNLTINLV